MAFDSLPRGYRMSVDSAGCPRRDPAPDRLGARRKLATSDFATRTPLRRGPAIVVSVRRPDGRSGSPEPGAGSPIPEARQRRAAPMLALSLMRLPSALALTLTTTTLLAAAPD